MSPERATVTLYRDHPAEGWPSMDRYATSLHAALQAVIGDRWNLQMPLPPQPWLLPTPAGHYTPLLARTLRYPRWARDRQGSVNHVLDHSYGHLLYGINPARTVVTVHDTAPLRFPGRRLGISGLMWRLAWRGVRRAPNLITVSDFTAEEVGDLLELDNSCIHVVPNAVAKHFRPLPDRGASQRLRFVTEQERLLLHVGNLERRKNVSELLRALAHLRRDEGMEVVFIQVGGEPGPALRQLVEELALEEVVRFTGRVSEPELVGLYNAADVFVFPSLYEGFGFPILEAMACGTPVVAAEAASLPEVLGNCGLLFNPRDFTTMAAAVKRVLTEPELAQQMRRAGIERAATFTWERTAKATANVYQQILEEG